MATYVEVREAFRMARVETDDRDNPLSEYVRFRIKEYEELHGYGSLKELADRAGIPQSHPSMVKKGSGVSWKTGTGYAKAFGFPSYEEFQRTAYQWWLERGQEAKDLMENPPTEALREAVELVLGMGQTTREQLRTILLAYVHPRFHDRDREWWLQTLLTEAKHEREALRSDSTQRREIKKRQKGIREVGEESRAIKAEAAKPKPVVHKLRHVKSARSS